jgi:protein O-mannosyl-transferase
LRSFLNRCGDEIGKHPRLAGAVLALITFAVFQRSLAGAFVFDDVPQILRNPYLERPHYWQEVFRGAVDPFPGWAAHVGFYRPLEFLLYWAVARVWGLNPQAFHLLQLSLYAGTVWLVFLVGRELLNHEGTAFVAALLWGLHPLHVAVAAWIAALGDAGAGFFMMASFWLFLRAEKKRPHSWPHQTGAALMYLPALFFKETALVFPFLLAAYWFFLGVRESWWARLKRGWPYLLAALGYAAARIVVLGRFLTAGQSGRVTPRMAAIGLAALGQHAKLFFWPVNLTPARSFDFAGSLHSPWPWVTLALLCAAFVQRKRQPRLAFFAAWWLLALLPCLDVRQLLGLPIQDNYSYLPSVGPCLAMAFAASVLAPAWLRRPQVVYVPASVVLVASVLWAGLDIRNVPHWHDDTALWNHAVGAAPDSALAHLFHGIYLEQQKGDIDGAARQYQAALQLNSTSFHPAAGMVYECDLGLGRVALLRGQVREAVAYFQEAVHTAPPLSPAYRALGALYFPQGNYALAARYFLRVVQINPEDVEARFFLGTCWMKLGKPAQAAEQFHAAREVDPTYFQAYRAEAGALENAGDTASAARVRRELASRQLKAN